MMSGNLFSTPVETTPINFGGGLNTSVSAADIQDNESPDMSNFMGNIQGAAIKRNGSKRYIDQAVSTNPVNSMFRVYASTGTSVKKALLMTSGKSIYVSTASSNFVWTTLSSAVTSNQSYSFAQIGNVVVFTGDKLTDKIKKYDAVNSSFTDLFLSPPTTNAIQPLAKYVLSSKGYLLLGNVVEVSSYGALTSATTFYPSRVYYSLLTSPFTPLHYSSFTYDRFLDVRIDDGEEITGMGEMERVHIFKESSIMELDFSALNLIGLGGDQQLNQVVRGFGLFAPRTLANTGDFYIIGAKDGLKLWDPGIKSRLRVEEESRAFSEDVNTIINKLIRAGTYRYSVGHYYPQRQWYIYAYDDPDKKPDGINDSVIYFDFTIGKWYRFKNWIVNSFASQNGIGDNGELLYGDASDGYVYFVDQERFKNDARKELSVDTMDSTAPANMSTWQNSTTDYVNVKEGTGSVRIQMDSVLSSSITNLRVINIGEWNDGTVITKDDKLEFNLYVSSLGRLSSLRIDFELDDDAQTGFDLNFTSVSISSAAIGLSASSWTTIAISLSSFPVRPDWISLDAETLPFANSLTIYGLRFVATAVSTPLSLSIDDVRIVQKSENPINAYWFTKQFNLGTLAEKRFRQLNLNAEIASDAEFAIDIYKDFGELSERRIIVPTFPKQLVICSFVGTNTISIVDPVTFEEKSSTRVANDEIWDVRYAVSNGKFLFAADKSNDRIFKLDLSSMSVFVSTVGSTGSGTKNYFITQGMTLDEENLYTADVGNNRVMINRLDDLSFVNEFGSLGLQTSSYHSPTGIAVNNKFIFIGDGGNSKIKKITKSTGGIVGLVELNLNTVSELTLAADNEHLFDAYNFISPESNDHQEIFLEKRDNIDMNLINKVRIRPEGAVSLSTYSLKGSIGLTEDFVYLTFTDDPLNGKYYIQKRLKSDFSIVKEIVKTNPVYTVAAYGSSYKPSRRNIFENLKLEGTYMQLRFYETGLDNKVNLFTQSFLIIPESVQEKK